MAKLSIRIRSSKKKGEGGIMKLKFVVEKIQKRLLLGGKTRNIVPEDVKEGHFAVIAESGEEPKRFVMPLSCLSNPTFLKLLEEAAQEYGFDHPYDGALTIPCTPIELESILALLEGASSQTS